MKTSNGLLSKPTTLAGALRARTCPNCHIMTPNCEMFEYGRCEDCWVQAFIDSFEMSVRTTESFIKAVSKYLTPREALTLFGDSL